MTLAPSHLKRINSFISTAPINVCDRQAPLRETYNHTPEAAWVYDRANTLATEIAANHPIHSQVVCGEGIPVDVPISVHKAVGGESDFPCPGEILAAALASCLDTAIRMIANLKQIELAELSVKVALGADVRGTMMVDTTVPVGFQTAQMDIEIKTNPVLAPEHMNALLDAAERSCVILQTLQCPPQVVIKRHLR